MKALITDVSKVLLFSKDKSYSGSLNELYKEKSSEADFHFFDYYELNTELLNYYKTLKPKLKVYILTSDAIQDAPELQPFWSNVVDKVFSASQMGTHKSKPEAYEKVLSELNMKPEEVIYVDDSEENLEAAKSVGLNTILYVDNGQVMAEIENYRE